MAYKITDDCISCGACETECPNQAISEGETIYVIDFNKCTECVGFYDSSRCAEICPVDACVPDPDHPRKE
jgi:ferredoxin